MSEPLRACPFCGHWKCRLEGDDDLGWSVRCGRCDAGTHGPTGASAAALWNRRTPGPATARVLRLVRGGLGDLTVAAVHVEVDATLDFLAEWTVREGKGGTK